MTIPFIAPPAREEQECKRTATTFELPKKRGGSHTYSFLRKFRRRFNNTPLMKAAYAQDREEIIWVIRHPNKKKPTMADTPVTFCDDLFFSRKEEE